MKAKWLLWFSLFLAALACAPVRRAFLPTATPPSTRTPRPSPTAHLPPTFTPKPPDTEWQPVAEGMAVRSLDVATSHGQERVTVVRIDDPAAFTFAIHYFPEYAAPVGGWAAKASALLTVNAGYFTEEYYVTGLTVRDGRTFGQPLGDFAGMFAVDAAGEVSVRWLRERPYDPEELLVAAVQSFPVLVKPGGVMGFPADADDGRPARRTVVAQDRSGRLLFLVAPRGSFSLHELAVWLTESDLDVDVALNLDGGTSSGLWLSAEGHNADGRLDSLKPVPAVITVVPKSP